MRKVKYLIIGAGVSGLTSANYLKDDYLILEKEDTIGGYCKTIKKGDFIWDYAGHFFHFKTDEFKKKFIDDVPSDKIIKQEKCTKIFFKNNLIDFPFQANIHQLEKEDFINCLYDLYFKIEKDNYDNFLDMLYGKFGKSITEMFLKPYNEKLYACDLTNLDKDAMGRFFPYANLEDIIKNMKNNKINSYNNDFLYPKDGAGYFMNLLYDNLDKDKILLNTDVKEINIKEKYIKTANDEIYFEYLINTIPFNQFLNLTDNNYYLNVSKELSYNKVLVFNLGFNKKSKYNKEHWIYIPDKNINFYRIGFYDNILNSDKLSMYIEIGYGKNDEVFEKDQLEKTLKNLKLMNVIDDTFVLEEYSTILMDPAYVHINTQNEKDVKNIMNELNQNNIYSIGRYGGWTYCSMEDCMVEAKNLAEKIGS